MHKQENERESLNFQKISKGGLGKTMESLMNKAHAPSSRVDTKLRQKDITFFTNENGEPIKLFIGKRKEDGQYSR